MYRVTKQERGFFLTAWMLALALLLATAGCGGDTPFEPTSCRPSDTGGPLLSQDNEGNGHRNMATGTVEIVFRGGQGSGPPDGTDVTRLAFASFEAREAGPDMPAAGEFRYLVTDEFEVPHREIVATLVAVHVDVDTRKAWMLGPVTSDTKGCSGGPGGGHEEGCDGGDEGGCSGHDDGDSCDGGHDAPDAGHDGGCDGHDTGGGCDGHDGGGGGGCTDHGGGGDMVSGKSCRVGQIVAVKLHDNGSPAVENDGISWKWFDAEDPGRPSADSIPDWPHLCRKTILGGNATVHLLGDPD